MAAATAVKSRPKPEVVLLLTLAGRRGKATALAETGANLTQIHHPLASDSYIILPQVSTPPK